jgi:thiol-disulfide isomerase/thioredoxin
VTRRTAGTAVVLVAGLLLAGCSTGVGGSGAQGYVAGKGVVTELSPGERKKAGEISGETLDGKQVSLADYRGKIVVVNVWGEWCPPCRAEADDLADAARRLAPKGVVFLGINTRDSSKDTALAFQRDRKMPYPSIFDPGGKNLLAFHGTLTPNAIPSTVVIDAQGRVAASLIGELTTPSTLIGMVEDVSAP